MEKLTVEITAQPSFTIVALVGAADLSGSPELDRKIMILSAQHAKAVIFDLTRLTFISSLCMGSLVRYRNACPHWGGTMLSAGATEVIATALKRARLDQVLNLKPTVEAAIAELS